jgi:hypothetical protein
VTIPAELIDQLFVDLTEPRYPPLISGTPTRARAHVQEILGATRAARERYL